jgi:hypothetical protein
MYKNGYHYNTKDLIIVKTQLQKFLNSQTLIPPNKGPHIKMRQINKILLM